jgi:hypothetical protein
MVTDLRSDSDFVTGVATSMRFSVFWSVDEELLEELLELLRLAWLGAGGSGSWVGL